MSGDVESVIRGPKAYDLARRALESMEKAQIWPTPLNFEIWLHCVGNPEGPLNQEILRLLGEGTSITEAISEELAAQFLPKARLNEQIRDAGDKLSRELRSVSSALERAHKSSEEYGETLTRASGEIADVDAPELKKMISTLSGATKKVQKENQALERRLADSTAEVERLKEHLEQVRRDASTDALTNLANRKAFDDAAAKALADAKGGGLLCLAVVDIDHFKNFNDTWGHQTGDQVIRFVASILGRTGAAPRFAARYGGEEFALLFPNETAEAVAICLDEVRKEISSRMLKRRSTNEDLGTITVSAGVAQLHKGETLHAFVERADAALYASKRTGRNRVTSAEQTAEAA